MSEIAEYEIGTVIALKKELHSKLREVRKGIKKES